MILISQAYLPRKIWGIETNDKSYLKSLSKSWTFHSFIKNNFKNFMRGGGLLGYSELSNFGEKNWNEWIKHLNRYNLSPKVWYSIAPNKWRFKVSEHRKRNKVFYFNMENKKLIFSEQTNDLSMFSTNDLVEETKKNNKLFKRNLLTYNFLDPDRNPIMGNSIQLGKEYETDIVMNKIWDYSFVSKKDRIFTGFLSNEKNIFFGCNLLSWFVPESVVRRNKYRKILDLDTSVVRHKNFEIFWNKELLRKREVNQSIRQWRWKSKNYEERFKKLGNMSSLMTFMQNQETMISLSGKMRKDLDLFRLSFRRNNYFNQLAINSEHRLPRLSDDQILIYKLITTSLNFKQRLKKISNLHNIDEYSFDMHIFGDREKHIVLYNLSNLEEILLPKRRREFRILNSLALQREEDGKYIGNKLPKMQKRKVIISRNKMIKRFIWSGYRFEDLACMNRFWFSTMNGSRFSMLRFRMYPTYKYGYNP